MLPIKFWNKTNGNMANPVLITLDDGTTIPVNWVKRRHTFCFQEGGTNVADRCNLSLHDFITIEMRCGNEPLSK